jgi:hypothetical protein
MNVPFNAGEDARARQLSRELWRRPAGRGRAAVEQARLIMLVMLNVAQLWILSATVEAALARSYKELLPLVMASGVCWLVVLSILIWWKPSSRRATSSGYVREKRR